MNEFKGYTEEWLREFVDSEVKHFKEHYKNNNLVFNEDKWREKLERFLRIQHPELSKNKPVLIW